MALLSCNACAGRGGWVATRNYEVDSGAYFINLLWNYYHTPGLWGREQVLNSSVVHDAVLATISTWQTEQHHEDMSPYRWG
jgi:meiotically up-regulated gene 157 (Mug157) protein